MTISFKQTNKNIFKLRNYYILKKVFKPLFYRCIFIRFWTMMCLITIFFSSKNEQFLKSDFAKGFLKENLKINSISFSEFHKDGKHPFAEEFRLKISSFIMERNSCYFSWIKRFQNFFTSLQTRLEYADFFYLSVSKTVQWYSLQTWRYISLAEPVIGTEWMSAAWSSPVLLDINHCW